MSGPATEPRSLVGKLHEHLADKSSQTVAMDAVTFVALDLLEGTITALAGCPAHELEPNLHRLRAYFDAEDLPPTGSHLHDLLSIKHAMVAFQGLDCVLREARHHPAVQPIILASLREVWPSVWRYLEVIEKNSLCANENPLVPEINGPLVMKFTVPSICNFLRQSALADTMEGSGVHAFFVRLWFRLATDERCEEWPDGFCGTGFNNSVPTEPNPIREQVIAPLGGEVNVAKAAVCHLRNAMCSMDRGEEESLFSFQTVLVIPRLAIVPELAYALLAQNAIRHVTRAMLAFATLPPTGLQTDALSASLSYVTSNIAFTDSITWVTQALNAGILIVLLRYETLYTSSDPYITRRNVQLLEEILPRYLIFLSVVQSARKAVKKAKKSGAANGISRSSDVWAAWVLFGYLVEQRVELAGRSARQKNVCNRCGRIEPKRRAFRQCSGCTDLYYCSSDCQRHDWDAQHRQDCKKIQRNRRAGCIVNSSESDYASVPAFVRQDFKNLGVRDLCRKSWTKNTPEKPTLFLDYGVYPPTVETCEDLHDLEGPTRLDLVCVHIKLPNAENTWFTLRCDPQEYNRTDRLIATLSSGLVVAQAEPGPEREQDWLKDDSVDTDSDSSTADGESNNTRSWFNSPKFPRCLMIPEIQVQLRC